MWYNLQGTSTSITITPSAQSSTLTPTSSTAISTSSSAVSTSVVPVSSSQSLPLGAIIGAPLAALALLSVIIIFLVLKLKRRREPPLQANSPVSPVLAAVTPFGSSIRERPSGFGLNDESRSATTALSPSLLTTVGPAAAHGTLYFMHPFSFSRLQQGKYGARTLATPATTTFASSSSDLNSNQYQGQSNRSDDLNATRAHRTLTISNPNIQAASTNISDHVGDPTFDSAPPAYDTLTSRNLHGNSSRRIQPKSWTSGRIKLSELFKSRLTRSRWRKKCHGSQSKCNYWLHIPLTDRHLHLTNVFQSLK